MRLGIMQPYLFPYIGYFQLINAVDKFVIYDDVNFIKQGWINRNQIFSHNGALLFTIPLKNSGSFSKINEVYINEKLYDQWVIKFLKTINQNYKKAPYFSQTTYLIEDILCHSKSESISRLAFKSLQSVCEYLEITKSFIPSSSIYKNDYLSGKERVVDICRIEKATHYINPIGGQMLYQKPLFQERNIELSFIQSLPIEYQQLKDGFIPNLSIIDILMFNSKEEIKVLLNKYKLI